MNSITPLSSTPASMSSREIAELTGKQHPHVMRDIRAMIEKISADPNLDWHCEIETYTDEQGKSREMYRMDKDTTLTLVSGYNAVLRFRIIKRWQELESKTALPNFDDPIAAAEAWIAERKSRMMIERERAEAYRQIEAMRPAQAFHDQIIGTEELWDLMYTFSVLQKKTGQQFTQKTWLAFLRRQGVACQMNPHSGIGKDRFVPRKDYIGTWFVGEPTVTGHMEWKIRPLAVANIVKLIEQERNLPPMPPRNALRRLDDDSQEAA